VVSHEPIRPLDGMRVLDLTRFVAGPYVTTALAALGADVVKLEVPPLGDPYRHQGTAFVGDEAELFLCLNSGKRSLAIDFRAPGAAAAVAALVGSADVVVQNARPGALDAHGLGPDQVAQLNPRAVYASISGYGELGPQSGRGGFDLILQAEGGVMGLTGADGGVPVAIGAPLLDIGTGMACLAAILAALLDRERTGRGARVSSSLLEQSLAGLTTLIANHLVSGAVPVAAGSHSPTFAPYGAFRARDGYLVLAGAGSEHLWVRLCELIDQPELASDPRFANNAARVAHRDDLVAVLEAAFATRDAADWVAALEGVGVPAGLVARLDQLLDSEQVRALDMVRTLEHPVAGPYPVPALPLRIDGVALAPTSPAPGLGAQSREVLAGLGLSDAQIDALVAEGIVIDGAVHQ
jgi:crotonobetainyl-CoA:carnitine CoA-transferase CaiB-like acyl-CoA transferase